MKKNHTGIQAAIVMLAITQLSLAQQINVSTPFNSNNSSFFESFGTNFGFSLPAGSGGGSRVVGLSPGGLLTPNVNFSQNGANSAIPSFGGFDPGSGARFGFGRMSRGGGGFSLGFSLAQGSSRTSASVTPNITVPNGGFGTITSGAFRPFVTGVSPVVGFDNGVTRGIASGRLQPYSPERNRREYDPNVSTTDRRGSSATVGAPSLAEIKRRKASVAHTKNEQFEAMMLSAKKAAESGDRTAARLQLVKARRATDDPRQIREIKELIKRLKQR